MKKFRRFLLLLSVGIIAFPARSPAPVVVTPGEGTTYQAPGSEDVAPNQKDAQSQFDAALAAEAKGNEGAAIAGYKKTVHRFPKSTVASLAEYKIGVLLEKRQDLPGASAAYEKLIKDYPHSTDFNNALEGEFRIGTLYLDGAKQKILGVPMISSRDRAVAIYNVIINNAPFSRYAPLAQFNIGQARERESDFKGAIAAYQVAVDKYPTDPISADALYQMGYDYLQMSRTGSHDRQAAQRARENFEDFLAAYPTSEKAAQAKEDIASLANMQTGGSLQIADYYYGQKQFRAAVVYYNDVIRQQPNSPDSTKAKSRLDSIRAKYGDKYFADTQSAAPNQPGAGGTLTASVKPRDTRLQAQTDTARRPDYVGPPVSAPTPPPPPVMANPPGSDVPPGAAPTPPPPGQGEAPPPQVPEGQQPSLPSQ
jgi:outer membrane protein assembly factor BamD